MHTGFTSTHPIVGFIYYFFMMLFAMLFLHPLFLGILFMASVIYGIMLNGKTKMIQAGKFYLLMGVAVMVINPLLNRRGSHVLFYMFNRPITLEATLYGMVMAFSLMSILILFIGFQKLSIFYSYHPINLK